MSKLWSLTWLQKREWELGDVEVKPCKKKEEFYEAILPQILYKSPYKYHLRIKGDAQDAKIVPTFKLVYSDSGETVKSKSFDISDKKTTVHQTNSDQKPLLEKMVSFNICSYKHGGRSFKLSLTLFDEKGIACTFLSPSFLVKAKKPIANPGIKSSRKRKHSKITKASKKSKRRKKSGKPKKKKRRTNTYKPKRGDERVVTLKAETMRNMMRPPPMNPYSPLPSEEEEMTSSGRKKSKPRKFNARLETQLIIEEDGEKYHETYSQGYPIERRRRKKKLGSDSPFGLLGGGEYGDCCGVTGFFDEDEDDDEEENKQGEYIQEGYHTYPTYQTVSTTMMFGAPMTTGFQTYPQPVFGYPVEPTNVVYSNCGMGYNQQCMSTSHQYIQPPPPLQQQATVNYMSNNMSNYGMGDMYNVNSMSDGYMNNQSNSINKKFENHGKKKENVEQVGKKKKNIHEDELVSLLDPHSDIDMKNYQFFDDFGPIKVLGNEPVNN